MHEEERGVWKRIRQKLHAPNDQKQTPKDTMPEIHLAECTCYECGKESTIEVCPNRLVDCGCWNCQREGKIEVVTLYCDNDPCRMCGKWQEDAARKEKEKEELKPTWWFDALWTALLKLMQFS